MPELPTISEAQLGAVLVRARRQQRQVVTIPHELWRACRSHSTRALIPTNSSTSRGRVENAIDSSRAHFSNAVFAASGYFGFAELWESYSAHPSGDIFDTLTTVTHMFVDDVPIELFNFLQVLKSDEFACLFGTDAELISNDFQRIFEGIVDARHAVAHEHDRNLGKSVRSGKTTIFTNDFNTAMLAKLGMRYVNAAGQDFVFKFEIPRLESFWAQYLDFLEQRCV